MFNLKIVKYIFMGSYLCGQGGQPPPRFKIWGFCHFTEVVGKSRGGSSLINCYCLERCVIFTFNTKSQWTQRSVDTTWTHGSDAHTPNWGKPFSSGPPSNSLSFP